MLDSIMEAACGVTHTRLLAFLARVFVPIGEPFAGPGICALSGKGTMLES